LTVILAAPPGGFGGLCQFLSPPIIVIRAHHWRGLQPLHQHFEYGHLAAQPLLARPSLIDGRTTADVPPDESPMPMWYSHVVTSLAWGCCWPSLATAGGGRERAGFFAVASHR